MPCSRRCVIIRSLVENSVQRIVSLHLRKSYALAPVTQQKLDCRVRRRHLQRLTWLHKLTVQLVTLRLPYREGDAFVFYGTQRHTAHLLVHQERWRHPVPCIRIHSKRHRLPQQIPLVTVIPLQKLSTCITVVNSNYVIIVVVSQHLSTTIRALRIDFGPVLLFF